MRIGVTALAALLGIMGVAATASAQETTSPASTEGFGRRAHNIFVLDDILGYADVSFKAEDPNSDREESVDPTLTSGTGFFPTRVVQLGYHYALDNGLTLGSGFGVWWAHFSSDDADNDSSSLLHLEARPRIGYAFPLSPQFAFWPRAGAGFLRRSSSSGDNDASYYGLSADIDVLGVITPAPHFGITAGLKFSIPMTGKVSNGDDSVDASYSMTSLAIGLLTDF